MPSKELTSGLPAEIVMETSNEQNGEVHRHAFEESGRIVYMNHSYYIRYEETSEEETVPVTVKINPDGIVNLIRQGEQATRLTFDSEKPTQTQYKTPTGIMQIRIETNDLKVSYYDRPFAGRVSVNYELYLGEQQLGTYQIRLRFTT